MNVRHNIVYLFLFLLAASTSCKEEEHSMEAPVPLRTVLFYLGGDNNLTGEASEKIAQIQTAELPPNTRVLIYKDTRGAPAQLLEIQTVNKTPGTVLIHDYEDTNSASPETFASLLQEVMRLYPSRSYGLVVFSHASGWMPEGTYNNPLTRSIIIDNYSEMDIRAFADAIPDKMLDFIVFETCFMAGIEVAWELRHKTKYIIASSAEIVSPGFTPHWPKLLPLLLQPEPDLEGFVRTVEAGYRLRRGDYASLTLSLINTHELDALATMLHRFSDQIANRIEILHANSIAHTDNGEASTIHSPIQSFDRYKDTLFFDFYDYLTWLLPEADPAVFADHIARIVPVKVSTSTFMPSSGGFDIRSHSGLTTYIPQLRYPHLNQAYKKLYWYKEVASCL